MSITAKPRNPMLATWSSSCGLPLGLLNDLPQEDQTAIASIVGTPVLLVGYHEDGRAELELAEAARPATITPSGSTRVLFDQTDEHTWDLLRARKSATPATW